MKVRYKKPKGQRIKKNAFLWIDTVSPENAEESYWWISFDDVSYKYRDQRRKDGGGKWKRVRGSTNGMWIPFSERKNYEYVHLTSAGPHVNSVKAFKRLCVKWSEYLPKGTKIFLHSIWVGHDITYTIK